MPDGEPLSFGTAALYLINAIHKQPPRPLSTPPRRGIVELSLCVISGLSKTPRLGSFCYLETL